MPKGRIPDRPPRSTPSSRARTDRIAEAAPRSHGLAGRLSRLGPLLFALLCLVPALAGAETRVPQDRAEISLSFAPVVRKVAPAVVNIFSQRVVARRGFTPLFDDPFFKRFFEGFGLPDLPRERVENSLGSGVIVSADGLVVTNHHVIKGADEIKVVLSDRREFAAELALDDERTDLAVLRIAVEGEELPHLDFRDSDDVEVGDLVLAIGNPFGVGQTVTSGIVSATARTQVGISDYSFFIQTDAAINPGNSGGALVTLDGALLGINTAIFSRSGGSVGIGFAIPANMVRTVVESARHGSKLRRPWSGFLGQTLTQDLADGFGLSQPGGVIVNRVYEGGPADEAGLKQGDVILSVDGRAVSDIESLRFRFATHEFGTPITLEIWRKQARRSLSMRADVAPETPKREVIRLEGDHPLDGAVVANLSPALAEELDLPGAWEGVIVLEIEPGSTAQRLRFHSGDLMLAVDGETVATTVDLAEILDRPADSWRITFSREGRVRSASFNR